jgi:hypothetical protein
MASGFWYFLSRITHKYSSVTETTKFNRIRLSPPSRNKPNQPKGLLLFQKFLLLATILLNGSSTAEARESFLTDIEGKVISKSDRSRIASALVELPEFNLSTTTDASGEFAFSNLPIPEPITPTTIHINAQEFGNWTIVGVRLVSNDTLLLEAQLEMGPVTIIVPEKLPEQRSRLDLLQASRLQLDTQQSQLDEPLPETIRVRIADYVGTCDLNAPYTVEVVDFNEYVKNVLPNEWYLSWPYESLRAGAMAVKMYAWQLTAAGGRYDDADVFNSVCDQVYIPGVEYYRTNNAIDFTWDWRLTHTDNGTLFRTHYLSHYSYCEDYGWQGYCMGQWETYWHSEGNNGLEKLTWDEMLFKYYWDSELSYISLLPPSIFNLRFYGNGWGDFDRVKILIDDPQNGSLPADVGDTDFTIEFWMKALTSENTGSVCTTAGDAWMNGDVILDRDVPGNGDHGEFGVSLMDGRIAFGVNNGSTGETLCGNTYVVDELWHHIAITRNFNNGQLRIFVDGELDTDVIGPTGDISYRDGRTAQDPDQDPYLVIGARKSDQGLAFSGWIDEMRISNLIRYVEPFEPPIEPFISDANTVALYHFDTGYGNLIRDLSGAASGPSDGTRIYGGDPKNGPEWEVSSLFPLENVYLPLVFR